MARVAPGATDVTWAVPARRSARWLTALAAPLLLAAFLYGFLLTDAVVQLGRPHSFFTGHDIVAERFDRWRDPPRVENPDWELRWGMAEHSSPVGPYAPAPFEEWRPFFVDLDPDLVRIFVGWREFEPNGPVNAVDYERLSAYQEAGFEIQAAVYLAPRWAASGGWTRYVTGAKVWSANPPIGYDRRENPYNDFLRKLNASVPAIAVWQVWNEPDYPVGRQGTEWNPLVPGPWRGSAVQYGELMANAVGAVHAFDDGSEVSTGGVSAPAYVERLLEVPGARHADIYDLHFTAGGGTPDVDWSLDKMLALVDLQMQALRAVGVESPQISISELSYPYTSAGARRQADFLAKAYAIGKALGWGILTWWGMSPYDPSYYTDSGLVGFDGETRPAYQAYKFGRQSLDALRPDGLAGDGKHVRVARSRTQDGRPVWLAWSPTADGTITWPETAGTAEVFDIVGNELGRVEPGSEVVLDVEARYVIPKPTA